MKKSLFSKFTLLLTLAALGLAAGNHAARADEKDTPLGGQMKIIAKSVKQLKNQIADPNQQQSSIQLVQAAESAAKDARALVPAKADSVPEADRPKFITDFQGQMDVLIKDFDTIDAALTAGKYDDAQKAFNDLGAIKRDGHKQFIKQD
jgi:soluble cytochrome b562